MCWAAAYGHYELVEWLVDNKGRVLGKDKFKRQPLHLACRNGHVQVASLLLQRGALFDEGDSSSNTPLHFAAAYGWVEIIDMLIRVGAEVNCENSWRSTPVNVAMLKNHYGCVKRLLLEDRVDVNCKDEKGRTLLTLALVSITDETYAFVRYLLKEKKADPNIVDVDGFSPLHYIAQRQVNVSRYDHETGVYLTNKQYADKEKKELDQQILLAKMLLEHGADPFLKASNGQTVFYICLTLKKLDLLRNFMHCVSLNKDPTLFFAFAPNVLNAEYQKILYELFE